MGSRRRNLFIIALVLALLVLSGVVIATKSTVLGLDLKGGTQLVYEARPTPQTPNVDASAIDRAINIIRTRIDKFGVSGSETPADTNCRADPTQVFNDNAPGANPDVPLGVDPGLDPATGSG